jgi:uncharacterized protein YbjT (DUF2867 family)
MTILVVGATGFVGGEIARRLARQSQKVAALVRGGHAHPKAKQLLLAGIEIIEGDLTRTETLERAMKHSEAVISTATSMPAGADDGLRKVDRDGTLSLIEAAERQGVKRFIYISYSGNIREDSLLETAKRDCENRLLTSKMQAVILRPSYFMDMWLSPTLGFDPVNGSARICGSGNAKVSYVSAPDVAEFGVKTTAKNYADKNTILEIGGPDPLSQLEAVGIFEEMLGKKIKLDYVPVEALQAQHMSTDPLQKTFGALMLAYAKGDVVAGAISLAHQYGIELRSVAKYAASVAGNAKSMT